MHLPTPQETAQTDTGAMSAGERRGLLALSLGVALVVVDMSVINLVIPRMAADLHLGFTGVQYVSALFTLAAAAVVLGAGDLADRIGARTAYLGGLGVFLLGSLVVTVAPTEAVILGGRIVQGIGGGVAMTAALGLINNNWKGAARGTAFALYGATFAAASAAGPLLGAGLAEVGGWRLAFAINLVLGPVAFYGVRTLVREAPARTDVRRPDIGGLLLASASITALAFGLIQGPSYGWLHATADADLLGVSFHRGAISPTLAVLVLAAALAAGFVTLERSRSRRGHPVIADPALTRVRSFTIGNLALLIVGVGEFGLLFLLPLDLQVGRGLSALHAGLVVLPVSIGAVVSFPLVDKLAAHGGARAAVLAGIALEAAGLLGVAAAVQSTHIVWLLPAFFVYGLGIGGATAQLTNLVLAEVPDGRNSLAGGISSAVRNLGSTLGVALLGLAFTAGVAHAGIPGLAESPAQTVTALTAAGHTASITQAGAALANGITLAGLLAVAFLAVGLLAVRRMPTTPTTAAAVPSAQQAEPSPARR